MKLTPNILFQDQYLMVIDKPAGLVSTPAETTKQQETLAGILQKDYGIKIDRGGVAHRLDKDTSGLILAAKDIENFNKLQQQFKDRTVKKEYTCLVHGSLETPGKIEGPIARNPGDREKFIVVKDIKNLEGREAVTKYEPLKTFKMDDKKLLEIFPDYSKLQIKKLYAKRYPLFTLLICCPLTGRTHQIRVHLKYIGHPIVGDGKYAGRKTGRLDRRWCKRQFLHASKIEFSHPVSGERISLESQLPEDLKEALKNLDNNG